jgi:tRNA threonylcarbamoyladenosine biosynthesis protein TsaB
MITLAIDTCDRMGSVGLRAGGELVASRLHEDRDYSSWLLPSVESLLAEARKKYSDLDLIVVATGPGSFTGVRVGLCAAKAWAEVYGKRVVGLSRLAAMSRQATTDGWVSASYDAHRGQLFGGLYRRTAGTWNLVEQEMVIAPEEFLTFVNRCAKGEPVQWVSHDPDLIRTLPSWNAHVASGSTLITGESAVANLIGELGEEKASRGEFTDVLQLDANYVRRCDAEIYWKGPAHRVG